jgi:hypothetical protein
MRSLDWRWQKAGHLLDTNGRLSKKHDDAFIKLAREFRQMLDGSQNDDDRLQLLEWSPALYDAWALWDDIEDQDYKWEIEARLCAEQTPEEIARYLPVRPKMVELYEALFFNVNDRLEYPGYFIHVILGRSIQAGINNRAYDALWKMFAYNLGPAVLSHLIYKFGNVNKPTNHEQVIAAWQDDFKDQLAMKGALAIRLSPLGWQQFDGIINSYLRLSEMERNAGEGAGGSEALQSGLKVFMEGMPWLRMEAGIENEPNKLIAKFDHQGVGLRSEEIMVIGTEGVPPGMETLLSSMKFPEEDKKNVKAITASE